MEVFEDLNDLGGIETKVKNTVTLLYGVRKYLLLSNG
jgi:hypothetical protein